MIVQDSKFNSKNILIALSIILVVLTLAFIYNNTQSKSKIKFLKEEKAILTKNLIIMKADADRLSALNEVNDIELQSSKYIVQQLLDSIERIDLSASKLQEYKSELLKFDAKIDSFRLKTTFFKYNNINLTNKNKELKKEIENLRSKNSSLVGIEKVETEKTKEPNKELKVKNFIKVNDSRATGFRLRGNKSILTNKASAIEKLQGCITIGIDSSLVKEEKVIYLQFLDPSFNVVKDNFNTINVNDNIFSKRVVFVSDENSKMQQVCDYVTIPKGSLVNGTYILKVFEEESLLFSTEFELK